MLIYEAESMEQRSKRNFEYQLQQPEKTFSYLLLLLFPLLYYRRLHFEYFCDLKYQLPTILIFFGTITPNISYRYIIKVYHDSCSNGLPIYKTVDLKIVDTIFFCSKRPSCSIEVGLKIEHKSIKCYNPCWKVAVMVPFYDSLKPNILIIL